MRGSELARRHARRERKRARRQIREREDALQALAGPPDGAFMPAEQSHVVLSLRVFTWFQNSVKNARK
jgi:hypothetical protein